MKVQVNGIVRVPQWNGVDVLIREIQEDVEPLHSIVKGKRILKSGQLGKQTVTNKLEVIQQFNKTGALDVQD